MIVPSISAPVELQEFLFATTAEKFAATQHRERQNMVDSETIRDHIRGAFRLHRFTVLNWLLQNGVKIPVELLADQAHPEVGQQYPDKVTA